MASFGEILAEFKKKEEDSAENLAPLVDDTSLRNGLAAWKSVRIRFKNLIDCELKDDTEKWYWLWDRVEYDQSMFGIVSGVKMQDVGPLLTRLKGLRLIYPDGTINGLAKQFLHVQVMSKLVSKRSPGRPKAEKSA